MHVDKDENILFQKIQGSEKEKKEMRSIQDMLFYDLKSSARKSFLNLLWLLNSANCMFTENKGQNRGFPQGK